MPIISRDNPKYLKLIGEKISAVELKWTIEKAYRNPELPNFRKVYREEIVKDYWSTIARIIDRFLKLNNIEWNDDQLFSMAMDLVERCPDWNIADIICFLKFIRQNPKNLTQLRIYQNFTPADLMRMIPFYHEEQAIVNEQRQHQIKQEANLPIKAMTVITENGEIKKYGLGSVVNKIADNLETGIKPKTVFEKARHQHDVKKEIEEHNKPQWKKEKEKTEWTKKISDGANKLGKESESETDNNFQG